MPIPGEVVWAWVPFEEDETRGKGRPVVIIGRSTDRVGSRLAGVPLTSKNKGRDDIVTVGTGAWDPKRRESWAKVVPKCSWFVAWGRDVRGEFRRGRGYRKRSWFVAWAATSEENFWWRFASAPDNAQPSPGYGT